MASARDELLYSLVQGDKKLHLGLAIVYGLCTVATVVFLVLIVAWHKGLNALLADILMGVSFGLMAMLWWNSYRSDVAALAEIGDDPTGIDTCRTYSKETASVISGSRKTKKELRQLWIAYGFMAVMLLGFGVFLLALWVTDDLSDEGVLVISGAVLTVGGILLSSLAIRAFREWLVARKLDQLG